MTISGQRFVPVVVIDDPGHAPELADALLRGGIGCAEITLRTDGALQAIEAIADVPGFVAGAGTVLSVDDVDRVIDAGARFIVSPGLSEDVVERAIERGAEMIPGVATATEVQRALHFGLDRLKLFPAGPLGGPALIRSLAGPFPHVRFLPSGGVTSLNAPEYLSLPSVFAVSGSWMATRELIAAGDFDQIARLSRAATDSAP